MGVKIIVPCKNPIYALAKFTQYSGAWKLNYSSLNSL